MVIFKPFAVAELFAGIGGFREGLSQIGGECVFSSEIDPFANKAYKALYGEETAGDIFKVKESDIPDHTILAGGFPCQAFSVAGKRGGFEDARGTLFFEILRIAKEKRPKAIFMENVKGLISSDKGRTLDTMITALSEIGYVVDYTVINSKYFGVPQNRERIFIVAFPEEIMPVERWVIQGEDVVAKSKRRVSEYEGLKTFNFDWPENQKVILKLKDVLERRVHEKYYLSEERTQQLLADLQAKDGLFIKEANKKGYSFAGVGDSVNFRFVDSPTRRGRVGTQIANTLEASGVNQGVVESDKKPKYRLIRNKTVFDAPHMLGLMKGKGHDLLNRVYSPTGQSPALTTMGGGGQEPKIMDEYMPISGPDKKVKVQNGRRVKDQDAPMFTLTVQETHGVVIRSHKESKINIVGNIKPPDATRQGNRDDVYSDDGLMGGINATDYKQPRPVFGQSTQYKIRKLTPLECWRLQGFSDEAHAKAVEAGLSDSQRYKLAGNAVTVNVIKAIGEKIMETIENASEIKSASRYLSENEREDIIMTLSVFGTKSEEFYRQSDDGYLEREYEKFALGR